MSLVISLTGLTVTLPTCSTLLFHLSLFFTLMNHPILYPIVLLLSINRLLDLTGNGMAETEERGYALYQQLNGIYFYILLYFCAENWNSYLRVIRILFLIKQGIQLRLKCIGIAFSFSRPYPQHSDMPYHGSNVHIASRIVHHYLDIQRGD